LSKLFQWLQCVCVCVSVCVCVQKTTPEALLILTIQIQDNKIFT
jgi:hypothetical protein